MKNQILTLIVLFTFQSYGAEYVTLTHVIELQPCVKHLSWEEHKYFNVGRCEVRYDNPNNFQLIKGESRAINIGSTQFFLQGLADGYKLDIVDFGHGLPRVSELYGKLDETGGREIKSTVVKY